MNLYKQKQMKHFNKIDGDEETTKQNKNKNRCRRIWGEVQAQSLTSYKPA
jgi:hypothetical protein